MCPLTDERADEIMDTAYASIIAEIWGSEEAEKFVHSQSRDKRAVRGAYEGPKKEGMGRMAANRAFGDIVRAGGTGVGRSHDDSQSQAEMD